MTLFLNSNLPKSLEFDWQGTSLGIKLEGDDNFTYVDLQGPQGEPGQTTLPDEVLLNNLSQEIYGSNTFFAEQIFKSNTTGRRLRIVSTDENQSAIVFIDQQNFHLLLTDDGSPDGTWNSLRPFYVNLDSGAVISNTTYTNTNTLTSTSTTTGSFRLDGIGLGGGNGYFAGTLDCNKIEAAQSDVVQFTPAIEGTGWEYSLQTGYYTRVGRLVNFVCVIHISEIGTSSNGNAVSFTGLPFLPVAPSFFAGQNIVNLVNMPSSYDMTSYVSADGKLYAQYTTGITASARLLNTDKLSTNTRFSFAGSYITSG